MAKDITKVYSAIRRLSDVPVLACLRSRLNNIGRRDKDNSPSVRRPVFLVSSFSTTAGSVTKWVSSYPGNCASRTLVVSLKVDRTGGSLPRSCINFLNAGVWSLAIGFLVLPAVSAAQTSSYTSTPCSSGTTIANGSTVGIACGVAYSKNGPNAGSRNFDLYYPTALGNANTSAPALLYLHPGGWTYGSSQNNWLSTSPNPAGFANFVAASGYNVYAVNYTLTAGTVATQSPAQQQDVDCMVRSLVHNRGKAGFPGNGQVYLWGSSAGAHLALLLSLSGPLSNPNCEYSDTYTINAVFANSPVTDIPRSYADNLILNHVQSQSSIQGYVPCTNATT